MTAAILGLSKLARVVDLFADGLQVQERLTRQASSWLQEHLQPRGVGVVLEAEHLCMSLRVAAYSSLMTDTYPPIPPRHGWRRITHNTVAPTPAPAAS